MEAAEIARGIQADQCYYFSADKLAADKAARAGKSNDVADYPNPDLAVEIDLSDPKVDRSDIDAQLRVPEVRRLDGESLVIPSIFRLMGPQSFDDDPLTMQSISRHILSRRPEVVTGDALSVCDYPDHAGLFERPREVTFS